MTHEREIAAQEASAGAYETIRYADAASREYHRWLARRLAALLSPAAGGRVLDAGCGTGFLADALDGELFGVDLSPAMLRFARARLRRLARADAARLPFRDGAFRAVVARGLLHHCPDARAAAAELRRVLAPGGELVVMEPHATLLARATRRLLQPRERFAETHRDFTADELAAALAGPFRVERVVRIAFVGYPLAFPDILPLARAMRLGERAAAAAAWLDGHLERVPLVRAQAWALLARGRAV